MGEVVFLSVVSVVVGLLVVRAFMPPSPSAVERWAQRSSASLGRLVADELWLLGASTGSRLLRWTLLLLGLVVFGGRLGIWLGYGTTYARAVRGSPAVGT